MLVLIAGVQQLVLSGHSTAAFAGVPLCDEPDWDRMRLAIRNMVFAFYGQDQQAADKSD